MATQKELHLCPALVVLRLARATKPGRNTVVSGNLTSLELSVAEDTSSRGFHLLTEKKESEGETRNK